MTGDADPTPTAVTPPANSTSTPRPEPTNTVNSTTDGDRPASTLEVLAVIWPTSLVLLTIFASMSVIGPALALIQDDLRLSTIVVSAVAGVFAFGRLLTGLPAGIWAERLGEYRVMSLGAIAFLIGSALCAWSPDIAALLIGRFVQGVGSAIVAAAALAHILRSAPASGSGQAISYYQGSIQVGIGFGPAVGGVLADLYGWRVIFIFSAIASALSVAIALLTARRAAGRRGPTSSAPKAASAANLGGLPWLLLAVGVTPNFVCFFDRAGINQFGLPLFLARGLELDATGAALVLTFNVVIGMALIIPGGRLIDRLTPARALVGSAPFVAAAALIYPLVDGVVGAYLVTALFAAGMAVLGPAAGAYLFALPGIPRNRAVGIYRFTTDLTQIVSPTLMGALMDRGSVGAAFAVGAAFNLALLPLVWLGSRLQRRKNRI